MLCFVKAAIGSKLEDIFQQEPDKKSEILRYMKDSLMPLVTKFVQLIIFIFDLSVHSFFSSCLLCMVHGHCLHIINVIISFDSR